MNRWTGDGSDNPTRRLLQQISSVYMYSIRAVTVETRRTARRTREAFGDFI